MRRRRKKIEMKLKKGKDNTWELKKRMMKEQMMMEQRKKWKSK